MYFHPGEVDRRGMKQGKMIEQLGLKAILRREISLTDVLSFERSRSERQRIQKQVGKAWGRNQSAAVEIAWRKDNPARKAGIRIF